MGNVTAKDTKTVILAELERVQKELEATKKRNENPVTLAKEAENKAKIESAEETIASGADWLNPEIMKKYKDLEYAISEKEERLKNLFGVENVFIEISDALTMKKNVDAQIDADTQAKKETIEAEFDADKKAKEDALAALKAEIDATNVQRKLDETEYQKKLKKKHDEEEEQYQYDLKISHRNDDDERQRNIDAEYKALDERMEDVEERESMIEAKEKEFMDMKAQIAQIPTLLENAKKEAADDAKNKANTSNAFEVRALKKDAEHAKEKYESEIASLREQIATLTKEKADYATKLDKAYAEMKDLTVETAKAQAMAHQQVVMPTTVK